MADKAVSLYKEALPAADWVLPSSRVNVEILRTAAIWHDAIYLAGAMDNLNEKVSFAACRYEASQLFGPIDKLNNTDRYALNTVEDLIMGTVLSSHLRLVPVADLLRASLLDADLASLAVEHFAEFMSRQSAIITEHYQITNRDDYRASLSFLETLAARRPFMYHTIYARNVMEPIARRNIQDYARFVNDDDNWLTIDSLTYHKKV